MQSPTNTWPTTPAAGGTLFFAQAMKAFLDFDSFEGFRAYSLDTLARLDEVITLGEDVLAKRVPATVLDPVFRELIWSLTADAAAKEIAPHECDLIVTTFKGSELAVRDKIDLLRLVKLRLYPRYLGELTKRVENSVNDPKRRVQLLSATGYLTSHLINDGHSREFLLERLQERFFTSTMKKVGAAVVRTFVRGLAKERNSYNVVHGVDQTIEQFIGTRTNWEIENLGNLPTFVQTAMAGWGSAAHYTKFAVHTVFAPDAYKAAVQTDAELERFKAFTLIPTHRLPSAWSRECVVHRSRGAQAFSLVRVSRPLQPYAPAGHGNALRLGQVVSLFGKMERSFDVPSKERLSRALAAAHLATKSTQDEARLLSLWSAFEVLLSEPTDTDVRILHFVKHLLPCICIKYHRRVFAAVHRELHQAYGTQLRAILRGPTLTGKGGTYERFAKLIVEPQFGAERQALLALCSNNPLALHRLFRLEKLYGSPKTALSTLHGHVDRVRWQLHRIYRVRNSLVHAGKAPEFTDTLVSNALDYLRSCMTNLVRVAARHAQLAQLDLVVSEVALDWSILENRLSERGADPFDDELAHFVFKPL